MNNTPIGRDSVVTGEFDETGERRTGCCRTRDVQVAEGLAVHADLSGILRDELGVSPSAISQEVSGELLHA